MMEIVFSKSEFSYRTQIDLHGDVATMELDTGSPITTISIPNLLQITGESFFSFQKKADLFRVEHRSLFLGVYGSEMNEVMHEFLPYLVKDVGIDNTSFPFFLFWVDITHIKSSDIVPTSILFGFDYIRQGEKWFDDEDNFHIAFDGIKADTFSVKYALSNLNEEVNNIEKLLIK